MLLLGFIVLLASFWSFWATFARLLRAANQLLESQCGGWWQDLGNFWKVTLGPTATFGQDLASFQEVDRKYPNVNSLNLRQLWGNFWKVAFRGEVTFGEALEVRANFQKVGWKLPKVEASLKPSSPSKMVFNVPPKLFNVNKLSRKFPKSCQKSKGSKGP